MDPVAGSFARTCHVYLLISWLVAAVASDASGAIGASRTDCVFHEESPWLHPCGTQTPEQEDDMSKILQTVLLEVRLVSTNKSILQFEGYSKEPTMNLHISHNFRLNWLPNRNQLRCFHREICSLDRKDRKKGVHILPHLYSMLQRFGITFYALKEFQYDEIEPIVQGEGGNKGTLMKMRREFLMRVSTYNLQIMCEVQRGIKKLKMAPPKREVIEIVTGNPHYKNRSSQMTDMILQDESVLAMYKTFLQEWMKIIRAIRQPARCSSSTMRNQTSHTASQVGAEEARALSPKSLRHVPRFRHYLHAARRRSNVNREGMKSPRKHMKNRRVGLANNYAEEQKKRKRRDRVELIKQRLKMAGKKCKWNTYSLSEYSS